MAYFEPRGSSIRVVVRLPGGGKKSATFDTQTEADAWAVMEYTGITFTHTISKPSSVAPVAVRM